MVSSSRRAFLAGTTGALASTSGCVGDVRNLVGRERTGQLSLTISTVPAGDDPYAIRIANRLADNLEQSGIETIVDPMSPDVLLREVLINHNFDLYVARYPSQNDPDELRSMLYSAYGEEAGWQNPFGFSDLETDEWADEQRQLEGDERTEIAKQLQRRIVQEQPFTVVGFPDRIDAVRSDRFDGWPRGGIADPTDFFRLERVGETDTLALLLRNDRITRNRNPIAVEHRDQGDLTGLLYESLVRDLDGSEEPIPWLARSITWENQDPLEATVQLRRTPWHDGEWVTARDVAFTYEFLRDTSLGGFDTPVPTPWRRGRTSIVTSVTVHSDGQFRIEFDTPNPMVAYRALSVPILPAHIWRGRADSAEIAGVDLIGQTTEALVNSNADAIGSGPFQIEDVVADESLSLVTFDDHFLFSGDDEELPPQIKGSPSFERVDFTVVPSHDAAVELLVNDEADASADGLQASVVPRLVRNPDVSLTIRQADPFYHIGYNCRRSPMTDTRFRRAVARHIDRERTMAESLGGYGFPAEIPLKGRWAPEDLEWDGEPTLPFFGDEGELDVEQSRESFREAGYQYDENRLIRRGEP